MLIEYKWPFINNLEYDQDVNYMIGHVELQWLSCFLIDLLTNWV